MNKHHVVPLEEVDGLKFGADRSEVRIKFGEYTEFKKTPLSSNTTDDFGFCHVYYDENNKMEAVEFFDADVYIGEIKVYPVPESSFRQLFDDLDDDMISVSKSIGIYYPDDEPEAILFGIKGYYE